MKKNNTSIFSGLITRLSSIITELLIIIIFEEKISNQIRINLLNWLLAYQAVLRT